MMPATSPEDIRLRLREALVAGPLLNFCGVWIAVPARTLTLYVPTAVRWRLLRPCASTAGACCEASSEGGVDGIDEIALLEVGDGETEAEEQEVLDSSADDASRMRTVSKKLEVDEVGDGTSLRSPSCAVVVLEVHAAHP